MPLQGHGPQWRLDMDGTWMLALCNLRAFYLPYRSGLDMLAPKRMPLWFCMWEDCVRSRGIPASCLNPLLFETLMTAPLVSILMVARNAGAYIDAAILSGRQQTVEDLEIVVVDDGSTDGTGQRVQAHMQADRRVRLVAGPCRGLSAVRNVSLEQARGRYAAILDSDDILHPRHTEWLLAEKSRAGSEICAANMIEFQEGPGGKITARPFARGEHWSVPRWVSAETYLEQAMMGAAEPSLGYLKPLLDMQFLRDRRLRYDETLRIGEDFDLVFRAMLHGARFWFVSDASYYYRRHPASTSHRISRADLEGLLTSTRAYGCSGLMGDQVRHRCENLMASLRHLDIIAAIKRRDMVGALRLASGDGTAFRLTLASLAEAVTKRLGPLKPRWGQTALLADDHNVVAHLHAITRSMQPV